MKTYVKAVAEYSAEFSTVAVGSSPGCAECAENPGGETEFSSSGCEGCGSYLAGSRHAAHGLGRESGEWHHLDICSDCVQYHANGELPESAGRLDRWRETGGKLTAYAWPGGYPVLYLTDDGGTLCPKCAEEEGSELDEDRRSGWYIEAGFIHDEGPPVVCDHCNGHTESAYGDPESVR